MIADGDFIGPWKEGSRAVAARVHRPEFQSSATAPRFRVLPVSIGRMAPSADRRLPDLLGTRGISATLTHSWSAACSTATGTQAAFALGDGTVHSAGADKGEWRKVEAHDGGVLALSLDESPVISLAGMMVLRRIDVDARSAIRPVRYEMGGAGHQ